MPGCCITKTNILFCFRFIYGNISFRALEPNDTGTAEPRSDARINDLVKPGLGGTRYSYKRTTAGVHVIIQ